MENSSSGLVGFKLNFKNSFVHREISAEGIANKSGNFSGVQREFKSRIPVLIKSGNNKQVTKLPKIANNSKLTKHKRLNYVTINRQKPKENPHKKEESSPDNDVVLLKSNKRVKVTTTAIIINSENDNQPSDAVPKAAINNIKSSLIQRASGTVANSNVMNSTCNNIQDPQTQIFNNNNNQHTVDFIEMLTLDANEFLKKANCVCELKENFCRECFNNNTNELILNNNEETCDVDELKNAKNHKNFTESFKEFQNAPQLIPEALAMLSNESTQFLLPKNDILDDHADNVVNSADQTSSKPSSDSSLSENLFQDFLHGSSSNSEANLEAKTQECLMNLSDQSCSKLDSSASKNLLQDLLEDLPTTSEANLDAKHYSQQCLTNSAGHSSLKLASENVPEDLLHGISSTSEVNLEAEKHLQECLINLTDQNCSKLDSSTSKNLLQDLLEDPPTSSEANLDAKKFLQDLFQASLSTFKASFGAKKHLQQYLENSVNETRDQDSLKPSPDSLLYKNLFQDLLNGSTSTSESSLEAKKHLQECRMDLADENSSKPDSATFKNLLQDYLLDDSLSSSAVNCEAKNRLNCVLPANQNNLKTLPISQTSSSSGVNPDTHLVNSTQSHLEDLSSLPEVNLDSKIRVQHCFASPSGNQQSSLEVNFDPDLLQNHCQSSDLANSTSNHLHLDHKNDSADPNPTLTFSINLSATSHVDGEKSCASQRLESIADEGTKPQEQALNISREFANVDDATADDGRRVPQELFPAAAAIATSYPGALISNENSSVASSRKSFNTAKEASESVPLSWCFKNGRLVFIENNLSTLKKSIDSTNQPPVCSTDVLSSKSINKRLEHPRLKYLKSKLKEPRLTDADGVESHQYNSSAISNCEEEEKDSGLLVEYSEFKKEFKEDLIPDSFEDICEFNVNDFSRFSGAVVARGVYDEFLEESGSSEDTCECDEDEEHFIVIRRISGEDKTAMVNNETTTKHNPDRDNLKSLLKKRGRKDKKSNRVVFNENKNEFFDADYIILIREDCELDEDDDDGICTCQQHEMVRLTCCEPNCNCQYEGGGAMEPTPQSPKFAPPMEFVDAVTLSPPEGYKDMELLARGVQQRGGGGAAVCRECSATHEEMMEDEGEMSQSDSEIDAQMREQHRELYGQKEKIDQIQQTTPTTPPNSENPINQNYNILESRVQFSNEQDEQLKTRLLPQSQDSPINGILKGGRLWKQQSIDTNIAKSAMDNVVSSDSLTSDDDSTNKRSVRFIESEEKRANCDGAPESSPEEELPNNKDHQQIIVNNESPKLETYIGTSPDQAPDMTLTFKLGNHVLISNNSLKPNSAVRQLFPCTKSLAAAQGVTAEEENSQQYLVTAESLRAFEEAKRSKLPQIIQSGETDDTIKRAIERNTLRRSLIRYEPRSKKQPYKSDNSLVERIKQLTCDVDNNTANTDQIQSSTESIDPPEDVLDSRSSPPGEEARNSTDANMLSANKTTDKSLSPSSSSTTSSSSSMSVNNQNNYHQVRKLSGAGEHQALMVDLKRVENVPDIQNNFRREMKPLPDIGGPHNHDLSDPPRALAIANPEHNHCVITNKISSSSTTSESRRQFLAPLTACVTMGVAHNDDYYYQLSNNIPHHHSQPGDRVSVASSGTEYSLEDIDEGLRNEQDEDRKRIAPDVLVGTPSASESGDELAMFVQQDAGRIERIKKKYHQPQPVAQLPQKDNNKKNVDDEDDEHDDYGFNRRPSVRGIKPRFSTTTEILQQIQNQLQPPAPPSTRVAWPYYSESHPTDNKPKPVNQNLTSTGNYAYVTVSDDVIKTRGYPPPQYRPTSLQEESVYQNCASQRCVSRDVIYQRSNANAYSPVIRMGNDYYQSLPLNRQRNNRPQSPPPMDMSKQYHQTMVYIPYNHIEGYQPVQYYHHTGTTDYVTRVSSQNQINKRYIEPVYQSRAAAHHHVEDHHYNPNMVPPVPPKTLNRISYSNNGQPPPAHVIGDSRSESPLPGQFCTARSTQTPAATMGTCGSYYPPSAANPRYRPMMGPVWQEGGANYAKINRHSFPSVGPPRYPPADSISLTDSDSQHSAGSIQNGYRQLDIFLYASKDSMTNSPTKPRFIERGVPEGAASVSPQDISGQSSSSTMTSPTSPQNPPLPTNQKAMFYAMNV